MFRITSRAPGPVMATFSRISADVVPVLVSAFTVICHVMTPQSVPCGPAHFPACVIYDNDHSLASRVCVYSSKNRTDRFMPPLRLLPLCASCPFYTPASPSPASDAHDRLSPRMGESVKINKTEGNDEVDPFLCMHVCIDNRRRFAQRHA